MLRRNKEKKLFPGCWGFTGGRVEYGESLRDAAKREVKEETNLDFEPTDPFLFGKTIEGDTHIIGHAYLGTWKGEVKLNKESSEYGWFTYEDAAKLPLSFNALTLLGELRKKKIL